MSKPKVDLNQYTDKEIIDMLMGVKVLKLTAVFNGISNMFQRAQLRGILLSNKQSAKNVDEFINPLDAKDYFRGGA